MTLRLQVTQIFIAFFVNISLQLNGQNDSMPTLPSSDQFIEFENPGMLMGPKFYINKTFKQTAGWTDQLIGIREVNIRYDYSRMAVCDYPSETAYLAHKKEKLNPTKFGKFQNDWSSMRKSSLEPQFERLFNQHMAKINMVGTNYATQAEVDLVVQVLFVEPEDHRLTDAMPPLMMTVCSFYSKDLLLARYEFTAIGSKENSVRDRLTELYGAAGSMLAKGILKKMRQMEKQNRMYLSLPDTSN